MSMRTAAREKRRAARGARGRGEARQRGRARRARARARARALCPRTLLGLIGGDVLDAQALLEDVDHLDAHVYDQDGWGAGAER